MDYPAEHARRRAAMVAGQLAARGVRSPSVLEAMGRVRRELYVPAALAERAYADAPLPIGDGQTISQPYVVAAMIEALELRGGERVLEVGTGSGYAAAVLSELAGEVITIERHAGLAREAEERLRLDGRARVRVLHGDGSAGWPAAAPYEAIVVAAAAPEVPGALPAQLAVGGRLVLPVGPVDGHQELVRITRLDGERFRSEQLGGVRFVPLVAGGDPPAPRDAGPA